MIGQQSATTTLKLTATLVPEPLDLRKLSRAWDRPCSRSSLGISVGVSLSI